MQRKSIGIISVCVITVFLIVLGARFFSPDKPAPSFATQTDDKTIENTVGKQWNWQAVDQQKQANTQKAKQQLSENKDTQYDVVEIHDALQNIRLNNQGEVMLDESTLPALQSAFNKLGADLTPEALAELQSLVKIGLPGVAGDQVADILGAYHEYLQAEKNLKKVRMATSEKDMTPQLAQEDLKKLSNLRREVLGRDLALQLYGPEEAQQRYLLSLQEIKNNTNLSSEEQKAKLAQLKKDFDDGVLFVDQFSNDSIEQLHQQKESWQRLGLSDDIQAYLNHQSIGLVAARELATTPEKQVDWESRYSQFQRERTVVINAGLSEQDKKEQIEWLMNHYFSEQEIAKSQNYLPHYVH